MEKGLFGLVLLWGYFIVCWFINLFQFFCCDFAAPYKDEIIKAVGVFILPTAGVTVWF